MYSRLGQTDQWAHWHHGGYWERSSSVIIPQWEEFHWILIFPQHFPYCRALFLPLLAVGDQKKILIKGAKQMKISSDLYSGEKAGGQSSQQCGNSIKACACVCAVSVGSSQTWGGQIADRSKEGKLGPGGIAFLKYEKENKCWIYRNRKYYSL